jgi:uncharacterized protein (TIGR02996 family)
VLAFLADVKEHPDEDGPRLIFADWLEENGDSLDQARAELIRSQVEYARLPADSPSRAEHGRRHRALQQKYTDAWIGPLAAWGSWLHQRGLLWGTLPAENIHSRSLAALAPTEAWAWVEQLYIDGARDSDVARLGPNPLPASVNGLGFPRGVLGPAGAQALARLPLARRLDKLDLSDNEIGDEGLRVLVDPPVLEKLRVLELCRAGLEEMAGFYLGAGSGLPRVERISLGGNRLGDEGVAALSQLSHLPGLHVLDLTSNQVGDRGAVWLSRSAGLARLRELNLSDNQVGPAGARALAESPHLDGLAALVLWGNPVGPEGAEALRRRFGARAHVSGGQS